MHNPQAVILLKEIVTDNYRSDTLDAARSLVEHYPLDHEDEAITYLRELSFDLERSDTRDAAEALLERVGEL